MVTRDKVVTRDKDREKEQREQREPKDQNKDAVKVFVGKDIIIWLRNGTKLKGKLETATHYELIVTIDKKPVLVMKHAVDYIELSD